MLGFQTNRIGSARGLYRVPLAESIGRGLPGPAPAPLRRAHRCPWPARRFLGRIKGLAAAATEWTSPLALVVGTLRPKAPRAYNQQS
jgi:hypothetical protein